MSFPRYPKYKASGVEWLGEVPDGWAFKPIWNFFRRVKRVGFENEQLLSVYRDYGVIPKASRDDNFNKPSEDLSVYQLVIVGDLAINKMKAWQGSLAISEHRGIVSPAYFVYEAMHLENNRYLHYLMRSVRYITGYLSISKGVRVNQWDMDPQHHSRMPLLVPPLPEQTAIAEFLDRETGKIDELVAEQRRLMELLKENITSLVLSSVDLPSTKRLRFRDAASIISRPVLQQEEESYTRIGLFNRGRGLFHKDASEMDDMGESDFFWIEEGDLIISGQFAWEGAVAMLAKQTQDALSPIDTPSSVEFMESR